MILEGNERGYGAELARHLMNTIDNDHVTLHAVEGFVAEDLSEAFAEAEAISQATQCQKYLFSLSLNPPPGETVPVEIFEETVTRVEKKLGLTGQPRALVFHEKHGRRHAHCVWSRIDTKNMKAIQMSLYNRKLTEVSRDLYLEHGWRLPEGFRDAANRDPRNYGREEGAQANREKRDPKALKKLFRDCWERSDGKAGFAAALKEQGYLLARGDRRGFVAVDRDGKIWSLSRWCGVKPKELRKKLGPEEQLPRVDDLAGALKTLRPAQRSNPDPLYEDRRRALVAEQRRERAALKQAQDARRLKELKAQNARLPRGIKGVLARVTGHYQKIQQEIAEAAKDAEQRDRTEQQKLIDRHLNARQELRREARRRGLSNAFDRSLQPDPRQPLIPQNDGPPYSRAQLLENPSLVLDHMSKTKAFFGKDDVAWELAKKIPDPTERAHALGLALTSSELVCLSDGRSFTTKDFQAAEQSLARTATRMRQKDGFAVEKHHKTKAIDRQNRTMREAFGGNLSAEQRDALDHLLTGHQLSMVVGLAGAGKSTLLATAADAWARQEVTVHGAALAGKAADGLESASSIASRTLASLETSWENGFEPVQKGDVLVIDEAGMIGTRQLSRVAKKLEDIGAKLVLVGDPDQLQPIEAGTPFKALVDTHSAARLTEIHRQRDGWQKQASLDLAEGRIAKAVDAYVDHHAVTREADAAQTVEALVDRYVLDCQADPDKSRLVLAHRRKDVHALNQAIRSELRKENQTPEVLIQTETGPRAFAAGDRIVLTRNDKTLGVKNGMLGTLDHVDDAQLTLDLDDGRRITIDMSSYRHVDHGYAVTIHKSQGVTVHAAYVLASRSMDKHLAYVAMTRHREELQVFVNEEDAPHWANPRLERANQIDCPLPKLDR